MQKTMFKTALSTKAIVATSLIFIAAGPVAYGISLYLSGTTPPETTVATIPTESTAPQVLPSSSSGEWVCTDGSNPVFREKKMFKSEPQELETWITSQQWTDSFGGGNGGRVTVSATFDKALAVRHLVGEDVNEKVIVSFSSRLAEINQSTLRCEVGEGSDANGMAVSSRLKGDNQIECIIAGKANKEGSMRIAILGSTKAYTENIPAYTCTEDDAVRPTFASLHPECNGAAGKIIPSKVITKDPINFRAYNPLVFAMCADGQNYDYGKSTCVDTMVPEKEPAGIIDLNYYGNAGCRPEDLISSRQGSYLNKYVDLGCASVITTNKNRGYINLRPGETKYFKYTLGKYGENKKCYFQIQGNSQQGVSVEPILIVKKDTPPTPEEVESDRVAENLWYPRSNIVSPGLVLANSSAEPGIYYIAVSNRTGLSNDNLISQIRIVDKCE